MNSIIQFHPMFPLHGNPHEKEAFIQMYTLRLAKIHAMNEEAKRAKSALCTRRLTELVNDSVHVPVKNQCQAFNVNNTPCKFRASCGRFCKKHQVSAKDLELFDV